VVEDGPDRGKEFVLWNVLLDQLREERRSVAKGLSGLLPIQLARLVCRLANDAVEEILRRREADLGTHPAAHEQQALSLRTCPDQLRWNLWNPLFGFGGALHCAPIIWWVKATEARALKPTQYIAV
jgi:hypothetical protein